MDARPLLLVLEGVRKGGVKPTVAPCRSTVSTSIVREGEAVALLGRNGVGKTTTLRAITGTVAKSGGKISIDGNDITHARTYEINRLGVSLVPEGRRLFPQF